MMQDSRGSTPIFDRDFEGFLDFLRDADGYISPERFAQVYSFNMHTLADACHVSMSTIWHTPHDENIQRYLRESLRIVEAAVALASGIKQALLWFKNSPIPTFEDKTGSVLASEGRTDDVLRYLGSLQVGFAG